MRPSWKKGWKAAAPPTRGLTGGAITSRAWPNTTTGPPVAHGGYCYRWQGDRAAAGWLTRLIAVVGSTSSHRHPHGYGSCSSLSMPGAVKQHRRLARGSRCQLGNRNGATSCSCVSPQWAFGDTYVRNVSVLSSPSLVSAVEVMAFPGSRSMQQPTAWISA